MRPAGSAETLRRRRQRAIALLREGWLPVDAARKVGVDQRSVRRWRAAFEQDRRKGLIARAVPGRPLKLGAGERAVLEKLLMRGAIAGGFSTEHWTCPVVRELIARGFGVEYHVDHVGRLFRAMVWTPQKPRRRARERDQERFQAGVRTSWPRVGANPGD